MNIDQWITSTHNFKQVVDALPQGIDDANKTKEEWTRLFLNMPDNAYQNLTPPDAQGEPLVNEWVDIKEVEDDLRERLKKRKPEYVVPPAAPHPFSGYADYMSLTREGDSQIPTVSVEKLGDMLVYTNQSSYSGPTYPFYVAMEQS